MRTLSTAQQDVLASNKYDVHLLVEVQSSSGTYQDLTSFGGANWVDGVRWDWSLDQPVPEMEVRLRRDHGLSSGQSLAPLDEASTLNVVPGSTVYTPTIDLGRGFRVYTAATTPGGNPSTGAYQMVFDGEVDDIVWAKNPMVFRGRSGLMSRIADQWLESSTYIYGTSSGTAIETVIQSILTDHTTPGISLWTPTSPGFLISPAYQPDKQSVYDAVITLAQLIGWDVRETWSSSGGAFQLKFYEPDRTPSTTDYVFGPSQYFDVHQMSISREDVRNVVSVIYGNSTSNRSQVIAESTPSQDRYGRRWMEIEEATNSAISSAGEANTLAAAALADLSLPPALHEIELPYWWPAELQDYYGFSPNGIHYDTLQEWGVYGISHELSALSHRTRVRVRGKPAGQYAQWFRYRGGGNEYGQASGFGYLTVDGTALKVSVGTDRENVAGVYYDVSLNGAKSGSNPPWPDASTDDQYLSEANFPYTSNAKSTAGAAITIAPDDLAEATFRFVDKSGIFGPPVYHSVVAPSQSTDGVPSNRVEVKQKEWFSGIKLTPATPSGLTHETSGSNVIFGWVDNATDEIMYEISRAPGSSGAPSGNYSIIASSYGPNTTSYTDTTVPNTTGIFYYKIRAYSRYAWSTDSYDYQADLSVE